MPLAVIVEFVAADAFKARAALNGVVKIVPIEKGIVTSAAVEDGLAGVSGEGVVARAAAEGVKSVAG